MMHPHPERNPLPPRGADRLLGWLTPPELLEEVQGDLHERFAEHLRERGPRVARRQYWRDVLGFMRPYFLRRKPNPYPNPSFPAMLRNYVTTTLRNLRRNKSYAFVNITGLSLGLACALFIFLVVKNELGYDRFHAKYDRIYRITNFSHIDQNANISYAAVPNLRNDFPQLERVTQLRYNDRSLITVRNEKFDEKDVAFADPYVFDIFDFEWVAGRRQNALVEPNTVVITRKAGPQVFRRAARRRGRLPEPGARPGDQH
jgi:putative ABC transport system permease protein